MQYRTDLAMERAQDSGNMGGVCLRNTQAGPFSICEIEIQTPEAAERLQKPTGRYITLETPPIHGLSAQERQALAREIAERLAPLLPPFGDVLTVGLGNRHITSDALGSRAAEGVLVTRHLKDTLPDSLRGRLRGVSALCPGVLGITGMETADMVRGAVEQTHPSAVIVRDALAALRAEHPEELARQLTENDLVVTPREIDQMVGELGQVLSMGINLALQPRMDQQEIATLMNEMM